METTTRGAALLDAHALINGERQQAYGAPEDCFGDIALLWNWWNGRETASGDLSASDVAMMMALLIDEGIEAGNMKNILLYGLLLVVMAVGAVILTRETLRSEASPAAS